MVETNGRALVSALQQTPGHLHLCLEEGEWSGWLHEILSPHVASWWWSGRRPSAGRSGEVWA